MTKLSQLLSAASAALLFFIQTLLPTPSPLLAEDYMDSEPLLMTEEGHELTLNAPPTGNRAFDLQVNYTSLTATPQLLSSKGTISMVLPEGSYPGGKLSRFTAAYNSDSARLTVEATLKPNSSGMLPTAFAFVLTDGADPVAEGEPGLVAKFYADLTNQTPILSAYAYSGSPAIPSWLQASSSTRFPDTIVSSATFPALLTEATKQTLADGQLFVRLQIRIADILNHRRKVINPNNPWAGTGFGENLGVFVSTYVGVQSFYSFGFSTLPTETESVPTGFLSNFIHQGTSEFNFGQVRSCAECQQMGMFFRPQAYWRKAPFYWRPVGTVILPCASGNKRFKTTDSVVTAALLYDPTTPFRARDAFTAHYVSAQLSRLAVGSSTVTESVMNSTLWPYKVIDGDILHLSSGAMLTVNSQVQEIFDLAEKQTVCSSPEANELVALFKKLEENSFQFGTSEQLSQTKGVMAAEPVSVYVKRSVEDRKFTLAAKKKKVAKKSAKKPAKKAPKKAVKKKK